MATLPYGVRLLTRLCVFHSYIGENVRWACRVGVHEAVPIHGRDNFNDETNLNDVTGVRCIANDPLVAIAD